MSTPQEGGLFYPHHWRLHIRYSLLLTSIKATRVRAIQTAYRKAEKAHPRDEAPKAGAIRNLGLLGKDEDTKNVLGQ